MNRNPQADETSLGVPIVPEPNSAALRTLEPEAHADTPPPGRSDSPGGSSRPYDGAGVQDAFVLGERWRLPTDARPPYPSQVVPFWLRAALNAVCSGSCTRTGLEQLLSAGEVICRYSAFQPDVGGGYYSAPANSLRAEPPRVW